MASAANTAAQAIRISHSLRGMPQTIQWTAQSPVDIANLIGKTTFPFAISFLLPMFVLILVKEKEDRVLIMMRMHGLSTFQYYFTHYAVFMVLQILESCVFMITGAIFSMKFFTQTDAGVYIVLLLLWANVLIGISFFASVIYSKSRFALSKLTAFFSF